MPNGDEIYNRARGLGRAGEIDGAVALLNSHAGEIVGHAAAIGLLGTLLSMREQPDLAVPCFVRSLAIDPDQSVVLADLGVALTKLNRADEALASFDKALALDPKQVQALNNRSLHWLEKHQGEPALRDADAALAISPRLMAAHRQRARALLLLDRPHDALQSIDVAIGLAAGDARSHAVRGDILDVLGRHDEALQALDRAVALSSAKEVGFRFSRACSHLRRHQFDLGWIDYEARWSDAVFARTAWKHAPEILKRCVHNAPRMAGQKVLVVDEQGIGDEIMFASVIPDLLAEATSVVWSGNPRLLRLLQASFPAVEFVAGLDTLDLAAFDSIVAAGDLCRPYRSDLKNFTGAPYLRPSAHALSDWARRLGPSASPLRIGLSWKGGVFSSGQHRRSIGLEALRPLLERTDCEFVSLQYGEVHEEVEAVNASLQRPVRLFQPAEIADFEDLAALTCSLDAVVSVQTALVHLSGALGAPCLVMLPTFAEWRYGATGSTMPWYESVTLFRQTAPGDWDPVVSAIGGALDQLAAQRSK